MYSVAFKSLHHDQSFKLLLCLFMFQRVFQLTDKTHGPGPLRFCWQTTLGNYLATYGSDNNVHIYDRHGERRDEINLPG